MTIRRMLSYYGFKPSHRTDLFSEGMDTVRDKAPDKKQQILVSAMKLFATQGYLQTTMQEIAQYCSMSKGSIYLHFSSKEELLMDIYKYYYRLSDERMQWIERDTRLAPQERLLKKIEVHLMMWLDYPEFVTLQIRENPGFTNEKIKQFLREVHTKTIKELRESLIEVYGESFARYALDASVLMGGIISTLMGLKMLANIELKVDQISRYILNSVDYVARGMLKDLPEPLISESNWPQIFEALYKDGACAPPPLLLIQNLHNDLANAQIDPEERQDALDSLSILEQELLASRPRRVVLRGMLANLQHLEAVREPIKPLVQWINQVHGL